MAERKAVNKYYPPDWDPRKGSVNKRVGQHPLRDRARKLGLGILVIRFELPYNIWCGGCGNHVGMGVRYNAEKSKVGNYYSTPIYKFRMKCHLCDNYFEIQTDPKNHDYVILSGARRKEQRWDPVANEQIVPEDKATQKKLAMDPMYKLEHGSDDQQKGKDKVMSLAQIEASRISMQDDYLLNRMARDKFRAEKKILKEAAEADRAILERGSLDIELVEETEEDKKLAALMKYSVTSSFEDKQKEIRKIIEQRPLFDSEGTAIKSASSPNSPSSSSSLSSNPILNRHNEPKKKLSQSLQASFKDPFQTTSQKSGGPLLSSALSRNKLGIRLMSSKNKRLKGQIVSSLDRNRKADKYCPLEKPETARKSQNKSQVQDIGNNVGAPNSVHEKEEQEIRCPVLNQTLGKSDTSSESLFLAMKNSSLLVPVPDERPLIQTGLSQQDTDSSETVISDDTVRQNLSHTNDSSSDNDDCGFTSSPVLNSGLQALISNYSDSDHSSNL